MMGRGLGLAALFTLALTSMTACGGAGAAAPPPKPAPTSPPSASPEPPPLGIEYVVLQRRWVERLVPTSPSDVKAWAEDPASAPFVGGSFRHILFAVKDPKDLPAAKKKAEGVLARLKKGEDFAKLAKQYSDDSGSKDKGGEYPADVVKEFVEPVRAGFDALAPGQTSNLIESTFGVHIVRKDRAEGEALDRGYRKAKAPDLTKKLADEILTRFKTGGPARTAIAEAVEAVLGERGAADVNRPNSALVDRDRLRDARIPAAAKAALTQFADSAHPGDTLPAPAVDGDITVIARAVAPGAHRE